MVAVIAGNGLGLLGTSLQQLGLSPGGQSSLGQSGASQYVNIATGNLVLQSQDERLVEQGLLAGLVRTYNSLGTTGNIGNAGGWLLGLDRKLSAVAGTLDTAGSTITRDGGDGEDEAFTYDATRGLYVASNESGADDTLQWNSTTNTWIYTAGGSRDEETYTASGRLTALMDGKSGASYALSYNASQQLIAVTASDGEALELTYDASGRVGSLSTLEIPPGGGTAVIESRVTYSYDTQGRLSSVATDLTPNDTTDSNAFTTSYTYVGNSSLIASLTQSDGLKVSYTYDANNRIASVTTGNGEAGTQTLSFSYDTANHATTVTDASGHAWAYAYDTNGNLTSITSPPVNGLYQVTTYAYTADGHLASVTDAAGNQTIYQYDAHGNRTLERDADGNTVTWTYNADDQVLSRTIYQTSDPNGTDPNNTAQASAPSTTWYVYDDGSDGLGRADQLRYVIDADGNVGETQYNTNGQVSLTRSFAGAEYDTGSLSASTAPTLSAMNTWVSSQDLTQTTRVDYSYDLAGRLTGKTAWDNVGTDGKGISDNGESITTYVYDAQGLLRQQITARGSNPSDTTSYSYDGLGRLIGSTDAMGGVTTYAYSGDVASGTGTLTITQSVSNGVNRVRTEVRNSAGELVTVTESASDGSAASRTTNYIYDPEGQLRAVQDPSGAISYTFYDEAGRISGTVDAMGGVTQYVRDADGRVVETKQYANAVDTTSWISNGAVTPADIATILPASSADDRTTLSLYDAAGMHVADVDALGDVTTYGYDGAGNLTTTTEYATALTADQLSALQTSPVWSTLQGDLSSITSANDRISRTFYDVANRAVATLDAAGYVTTTAYDAAGRITRTTAFATALDLTTAGNPPSLSDVVGVAHSGDDQTTRYFYDSRGQLIAQLDADGYLTTTAYDETANTTTSTRYALQLTGLSGSETLATLLGDLTTSSSQTSIEQYDAEGRLSMATAVDGTVTSYVYDEAGNLLSSTVTPASGSQGARETDAGYDAFGDVLTTTDAVGNVSKYTYNVLGQKVESTDPLGNNTWYFYDADGRLIYTVRGMANSTGNQNALGEVSATTYNALGQVTAVTRYAGWLDLNALGLSATTSVTLSALQAAVNAIAGKGANPDATTSYSYALNGLTASIQDALGYTTGNVYDAFDDVVQTQQQLSQPGQALSASNSTVATYSYDARGERIGEVDDTGGLNRATSATYDAFGRVTSRTDGNGHTTTYSYDALGRQISVSEAVQGGVRTASTTYDAYGRVLTTTDALGQVTQYGYSADTHTVTVTTPDGVKLTTTKDAYGDTLSVTDSLNNTTSYTYDADGRLLTKTDALGNVTTDAYDADGNLISATDAKGVVTTYTYDATGRVLTRTLDPSGNDFVTTYAYDGRGQQISVTDPGNVVTTYGYDSDGNVLTVVKDAGTGTLNLTTTYTWDGAGHQLSVTEGAGTSAARTTQYTYDNLGRLITTQVDPSGLDLTTRYSYDANNNLVAKTDADGNVTRYVYNEANERVFTIDAAGDVTRNWYDADGRVTSTSRYAIALTSTQLAALGNNPALTQVQVTESADDQTTYIVYNNDGQVGYTIDACGFVSETRYDAVGRVSETLAYANGIDVSSLQAQLQQGTAFPLLASAVTAGTGNTDQNAHATLNLYDTDGQVRFVVQQNMVNGQLLGIVSEKRYDANGQLIAEVAYGTPLVLNTTESLSGQFTTSSVEQLLAGSTNLHSKQYVYSNVGTLRYIIDTGNYVTERQYDRSGNLTAELRWFTAITVPGALTTASVGAAVAAANSSTNARFNDYAYDRASRLVSTADNLGVNATYTYDALGQKLSYTNRDGATWAYAYDGAGRLTQETSPAVRVSSYNGSGNSLLTTTANILTQFVYDANGNVIRRSDTDSELTDGHVTQYYYDALGRQVKTVYQDTSYTSVTYNALGQAVVNRDVNGHYEYKAYDQDGQVAYEVDGNGYLTSYDYDAYGNQTQVTRYATALNAPGITGWSAGHALSSAQVQQGLVTNGNDRTLATTYDQLNRKVQVQQATVYALYTSGPNAFYSLGSYAANAGANAQPTTTYTYDAFGNLASTSVLVQVATGTAGQSGYYPPVWATTYDYYDALNRKTLEVDPAGYVSAWAYDATGAVKSYTEYAKAISTSGLSTSTPPALPPAGDAVSGFDRVFHYGYDSIGRKTNEIDYGGYSYDVSGAQEIESGAVNKTFAYDGEGRLVSATVNRATTTTTYDALGRVLSVTSPARPVLVSNWQSLLVANPTWDLTNAGLYETASAVTTFTYDSFGNALSSTVSTAGAAGGSVITYSHYDSQNRVSSETDAAGTTYTNTYDAAGNLLSTYYVLSGLGVLSSYAYDSNNQRTSAITQRYVGGKYVTESAAYVKYDAFGEVSAKGDNPNTYEITYAYKHTGQLVTETDAKTGASHEYFYDLQGNLVEDAVGLHPGTDPSHTAYIMYAYDLDGRRARIMAPSSSASSGQNTGSIAYTYDRWGNVLSTTDARGYTTTYEYDSQNHLIKQTEPQVMVVASDGRRYQLSPTKEWYYDGNGRLVGVTDENGHTSTRAYDVAGELTASTDAVGAVTHYAYDGLGRQVATQTPITSTSSHITWQDVDALGRVIAQGDFLLNGSARVKSTQQQYVLDQDGNRIKVTDAIGDASYYSYDSQGHLLASQTTLQHAAGVSHTYVYDANGNKTKETDATGASQTWTYDYFGRVLSHTDMGGEKYTYTYDANSGLLTKVVGTNITAQSDPSYVPMGDHIGNTAETYSYYADGQIQQVTQQVTVGTTTYATGTTSYKYDADGNQTDQNTQTSDGAGGTANVDTQSSYDSHNRLSEVTEIENGAGVMRTAYNYDAAGNRRAVFVQSAYGGTPIDISASGAPTVGAIPAQTVQPGAALNFNAAAYFTDKLGFGLTYTAANFPSWMHLNSAGVLFGTAPTPAESWAVTVTATDALGRSVSANITVAVPNLSPTFSGSTTNRTYQTGTAFSFTEPNATDPNGDTLKYTSLLLSGQSLPSWLHFNASTLTWSGTAPSQTGTWTVVYWADDGKNTPVSKTFTLTVASPASSGPVYDGGIPATVYLDVSLGSPDTYTFPSTAFSSPANETLTYSAVLTGTTAEPTYLPFNGSTRTFTANVTIADHNPSITLTAKDTQGRTVSHTFSFYITGKGTINNNNYAMPAGGAVVAQSPSSDQIQTESFSGGTTNPDMTTAATSVLAATQATTQSTTAPNVQAYWFTYDYDNRVDISGGTLNSAGQIVVDNRQGSMEKTYDLAGDEVKELTYSGTEIQTFDYDARGQMIGSNLSDSVPETRQYDADGRLIADVYYYRAGSYENTTTADGDFRLNISGWLASATTYYYDADGRVTATYDYSRINANQSYWNNIATGIDNGRITAAQEEMAPTPPSSTDAANGAKYGVLDLTSHVAHWGLQGQAGYDAEGHALNYTYSSLSSGTWSTTAYTVSYIKKDAYLERSTTGTNPSLVTTTDTSLYDAFGRRVDIVSHSASSAINDQVRAFAYDANGQILERRDGTVGNNGAGTFTATGTYGTHHYAYANGQQIGEVDEAGNIDVLSGVTGFSNTDEGTTTYVAQDGDTMSSIAQQVYGDASLWYVVADANGYSQASDAPTAGESLKLPQVTTSSNTSETFKPYNPNDISGSTTPSLPQAPQPPPSAQHCSTLAMIVVIAVVVVASIFTAGVAAEAFAGTLGSTGVGGIMAAGSAAMVGGTAAATAGLTGLAGTAELMGAAAIGGAVGDAAGQLVGDAEGIHQGFSFGEMLGAGLGAGITAGAGGLISGGKTIAQLAGEDSLVADAKIAGIGAAGSIGNYAGEKLAGQPAHFSWADVAAAAIGTEVTAQMHLPTTLEQKWGQASGAAGSFAGNLVGGLVNGAIDSETARLLGGDAQNGRQVFEDAFGNALGNAAIAGIEHSGTTEPQANSPNQESGSSADGKPMYILADNGSTTVDPTLAYAGLSGQASASSLNNDATENSAFDAKVAEIEAQSPQMADINPFWLYSQIYGPANAIASPDDTISIAYDEAQKAGYQSAFEQTGKADDAKSVADAIGVREQLETQIAQEQNPNVLAKLGEDYTKLTYALISDDAYYNQSIPDLLPASISRIDLNDAGGLAALGLDRADLDPQDGSGFFAAAYYDSSSNTYIIANRGTELNGTADIAADFRQSQGLFSQQYQDAFNIATAIQNVQLNGSLDANIVFTGHSLGGGLAALEALATGDPAYTFNAAGLNQGTMTTYGLDLANAANIQAISVEHEPLSTAQDTQWPRVTLATSLPWDLGVPLAASLSLPAAVGEHTYLPAVSSPVETLNGIEPGAPYSRWALPYHTPSLHGINSVISSIYYQAEQDVQGH